MSGYAITIEDDPNQNLQSKRKTYAPIAFGSKTFNPTQTKLSIYAKKFFSIYFPFVEFGHFMWGSTFPVIVFTDNRSVTQFFQAKMIFPVLWNACDYVLQCNFVSAHVAGISNHLALSKKNESICCPTIKWTKINFGKKNKTYEIKPKPKPTTA